MLDQNATNVFIAGLRKHMKGDVLKAYFSKCGHIINIYRAVSVQAHTFLGFGFVSFVEGADVEGLLSTEQHDIGCGFVRLLH
ncbi:unnamed protein product [Dibothriocephalus latus]|uniref:RRM domain-containing protein n=1 Tax=Dibothriocephalus latus TaxID=60516 RepID=A0A3P7PG52_DIBLA|nr:unnamed protein product [Dibothriocephalus latus]